MIYDVAKVGSLLAVSTVGVALITAAGYHAYLSVQWKGEAPVRWSFIPLLGWGLEMAKRPIALFQECAEKYGEVFGIVVGGSRMFIITDPHSYDVILKSNKNLSVSEFHNSIAKNFFGVPLADMEALDDNYMRALYSKYLFSDTGLHQLTNRMQKQLIKRIKVTSETVTPMQDFLGRMILEASFVSLFNNLSITEEESLLSIFNVFDQSLPLAAAGIDVTNFNKINKARQKLINYMTNHNTNTSDFIRARAEYLQGMVKAQRISPNSIDSCQNIMLWSSSGNTIPAIFWVVYFILSDQAVLQRAITEVDDAFLTAAAAEKHTAGDIPLLTQDTLNSLQFLDACITETLRLSSGSLIMRFVRHACTLTLSSGNTYRFRRGDKVGLCPPLLHLDSEVFPSADQFNPDRWLQGDSSEARVTGSLGRIPVSKGGKELSSANTYLVFGGGQAYCPGRRFARNEMKTVLVYLLHNFKLNMSVSGDMKAEEAGSMSVPFPGYDGQRAGLGIFPPLKNIYLHVAHRKR